MDEVATAQLELLYKLGVLEREPVEEQEDEVYEVHPLLRLQSEPLRQTPRQRLRIKGPIATAKPSPPPHHRLHKVTELWFLRWKLFVRDQKDQNVVKELYLVGAKKQTFRKWRAAVRSSSVRRQHQRTLQLWKLRRGVWCWRNWTRRIQQIHSLLSHSEHRIMNRLRKQRVWIRWTTFAARQSFHKSLLQKRRAAWKQRLTRGVWIELKIHALRSRQSRRSLGKFLCAMRLHREIRLTKQQTLFSHRRQLDRMQKARLLRGWRQVIQAKVQEHFMQRHVERLITRRRFFSLWHETFYYRHLIARVHTQVVKRSLRSHFQAWRVTTQAIIFGVGVNTAVCIKLREQVFKAWKQHVRFSMHSQMIAQQLKRRRQQNAVRRFRRWTIKQKRQRVRMGCFARNHAIRMLKHVWRHGWLIYHEQECQKRTRERLLTQMVLRRSYRVWKQYWLHVVQQKQIEVKADHMALVSCFKAHFKPWKTHRDMRIQGKRRRKEADIYYRSRLKQLALGKLWQLVDQRNLESQQCSTLRRKARLRLAGRCFGTWKKWFSSRRHLEDLRAIFQHGHRYEKSIWNPLRRLWDRWLTLVEMARQCHRSDAFRNARLIERSFIGWTTHYRRAFRIRRQRRSSQMRTVRGLYRRWLCRIAAWKRKRDMVALARRSRRRCLLSKVLKAWSKCCTRYIKRIRMQFECLQNHSNSQLSSAAFRIWYAESQRRTLARQWKNDRQATLTAMCFAKWRYKSVQSVKLKRKLIYFSHAIGKYPATSLMNRVWISWKRFTVQRQKLALMLRHQAKKRIVVCLTLWRCYHFFCDVFRQWHLAAALIADENKHLGRRIRLVRELQQRRRKALVYTKWKAHYRRKKLQYEAWIRTKHCVTTEIVKVHSVHERGLKRCVHSCFQKWKASLDMKIKIAIRHHALRFLRKILHCWWTVMVHGKQDRMTCRVKQSSKMTNTFYHPQQQLYIRQARAAIKTPKRRRPQSETNQTSGSVVRAEQMKHMRRMMDPIVNTGYLDSHQNVVSKFENGSGISVCLDFPRPKEDASIIKKTTSRQILVNIQPHLSPRRRRRSQCHVQLEETVMNDRVNQFNAARLPLQDKPCPVINRSDVHEEMVRMKNDPNAVASHDFPQQRPLAISTSMKRAASISNVLPLFDADINQNPASKTKLNPPVLPFAVSDFTENCEHQESVSFDTLPPPPPPPSPPPVCVSSHRGVNTGTELSLENLAQMDVYTTTMPSQVESIAHRSKNSQVIHAGSKVTEKSTGLHKRTRLKNRNVSAVPKRGLNLSLAAILEMPEDQRKEPTHIKNNQVGQISSEGTSDREILIAITAHYTQQLHSNSHDTSKSTRQQLLAQFQRTCFCMTRDLALFRNDFYLNELEDVVGRSATIDTMVAVLGSEDKAEMDKIILQRSLQEFLDEVVESHPLYTRFCSKLHKNQREWQSPSDLALNSLRWLVQIHLRPRLTICNDQYVWVKHVMPVEMCWALEKLWLCVTKYKTALQRFFSWRDESQSTIQTVDHDHRMRKDEFLGLMKHAHTFPQLLHRREVENAVDMSCCCRPSKAELNFPEFIEALVRCSLCLQWGESRAMTKKSDKEIEMSIVIKFLMLIFAMEGRGSVLSKRNDDLQIVVSYLERQNDRGKADKMQRFHGLLAQRKGQIQTRLQSHSTRSIWRSLNHHTRQQDETSLISPEEEQFVTDHAPPHELREAHYSWTDQQAFEWTNSRMPAAPLDPDYWHPVLTSNPNESIPNIDLVSNHDALNETNQTGHVDNQLNTIKPAGDEPMLKRTAEVKERPPKEYLPFPDDSGKLQEESFTRANAFSDEAVPSAKRWEFELQDKNEFLANILSNIDDVELLLHQSRSLERDSETDKSTADALDDRSFATLASDYETSQKYLTGTSIAVLEAANPKDSDDDVTVNDLDIKIQDPMLNHLTNIERFTELAEPMEPHIQDVSVFGILSAFTASEHALPRIQDAALDSVTDPRTSIIQAMELIAPDDESKEGTAEMEAFIE